MPKIKFRPSRTILKTAEYTSIFLVAFSSLFVAQKLSSAPNAGPGQLTIEVQTWDQIDNSGSGATDPGDPGTILLKGRDAAGTTTSTGGPLYQGSGPVAKDGDLIELGYYKRSSTSTPNVDGTNLFVGTWTPLTSKTTIGHVYDTTFWSDTSKAGEFFFDVTYIRDTDELYSSQALINNFSDSGHEITNDTPSGLGGTGTGNLWELDNATEGAAVGSEARLGIRFYDISTSANTGGDGTDKTHGTTRYNTIMNPNWKWDTIGGDMNAKMYMNLHATGGGQDGNLVFEFDNSDHNAYSKVGTSDTAVGTDDFVTSIAYHDGTSAMALNTIGSVVLSGLSGQGDITDGGVGKTLTLHTAAGNMLVGGNNDGTSFAGGIAGDITIIKTGGTAGHASNDGEQTLTGVIAVTDTTGYADIKEGTLILAPNGNAQSFEYITGAGNLDLVNSGGQTVELGFASTTTTQTLSGAVDLSGTGTATTIKVVSDTAKTDANYNKEQVFSGVVSGTETLTKDGLGRLMLSGANTFALDGGGTDVIINDGTLVAGHADALGGANQVVINKGKLELGDGNNGAVTLNAGATVVGSSSGKSIVGGDGTIANLTLGDGTTAGSAATDVNVISPGRGISSSLSPSNQQVTLGTGGATKAMGEMTVTNLVLNPGAVFDWEITDFDGGNGDAGEDWDILSFGDLDFTNEASSTFTVNVFSVASDGTAGGVADLGVHSGNQGILFLKGDSHANIDWGTSGSYDLNSGVNNWQYVDYFNVDSRGYNFHNGNLNGGWGVWYNGSGDFYLRYSAVPEPSTYVMVMGLLLVPGFRFFRRFRKKGIKQDDQ